jgi:hypothetical protein
MGLDHTKDLKIGIYSVEHAALLRSKSKYWLARNLDNVSGCRDFLLVSEH